MVYQYVVTLQNNSRRLVDRFSLLLCSASAFIFLVHYLTASDKRLIHLMGALLLLVLTVFNAYKSFWLKLPVFYNYHLYITALIWASMPFYPWLSGLFLVMGLLERQAKKNLEIGFSDDRIVFNSFPRKQFQWSDFSNIVLRDNLLTLDFSNNKLFQRETIDEEGDADEDEFNEYCRQQFLRLENNKAD
ncbi:hypothetical protein [Flavihumibacter profundi]|jgi:hypothetical protein|uniref:hypothetical protein n=1 Tax=Flavihumibacter profundi TaxID=2716883 RepID=UPI001CC4DEC0|nr:hypothetical protein [Flavihumibacter profundi]MBZ5855885.1 hypothetical protein [Flavihumibacter profundi]